MSTESYYIAWSYHMTDAYQIHIALPRSSKNQNIFVLNYHTKVEDKWQFVPSVYLGSDDSDPNQSSEYDGKLWVLNIMPVT